MNVVGALVFVLLPALLPALALTRSATRAVLLCAPVCVVVGGVSGIVCVLLRVPVAPCAAVLFVAANVAALIVFRHRGRDGSAPVAVAEGDLSQHMAAEIDGRPMRGEFLLIGRTVNTMVDQLSSFAAEVTRVAREVGTEGKLGGQA